MPWPSPNNTETLWTSGSLAAGSNLLSIEYDQDSTRYLYARFWLGFSCSGTTADYTEMYILAKEPGGSNYPDGNEVVDPKDGLVHVWKTNYTNTTGHHASFEHCLLPNSDFKVLLKSENTQTLLATLKMQRYNEPTS